MAPVRVLVCNTAAGTSDSAAIRLESSQGRTYSFRGNANTAHWDRTYLSMHNKVVQLIHQTEKRLEKSLLVFVLLAALREEDSLSACLGSELCVTDTNLCFIPVQGEKTAHACEKIINTHFISCRNILIWYGEISEKLDFKKKQTCLGNREYINDLESVVLSLSQQRDFIDTSHFFNITDPGNGSIVAILSFSMSSDVWPVEPVVPNLCLARTWCFPTAGENGG